MLSRTLLNLTLLTAVAALALLAFYQPGVEQEAQPKLLTGIDPASVRRISIERKGHPPVVVERSGSNWRMLEPLIAPADDFRLDAIVQVASAASHADYDAATVELEKVGLAQPRLWLTLNDELITFGAQEPLKHRRYVLVNDRVHLIDDTAYYHLSSDYPGFVSRRLLPEGSEPVAFHFPEFSLEKQDGRWEAKPRPADYSADSANRLADFWRHAEAVEVKRYDRSTEHPRLTISLTGEEEPLVFEIVSRSPELVLARPDLGVAYDLGREASELFTLSVDQQINPKP